MGVLLVAALALAGCLGKSVESPPLVKLGPAGETLLFRDVSLFAGTGLEVAAHQDVLVEGGKISRVGPTGAEAPAGARVIEGKGRTLLPGLIDSHVHVTASGAVPWEPVKADPKHNLEAWLAAGVTTVYDLGGPAGDLAPLKAAQAKGELPGPRLFHTDSPITAPGGHPLPAIKALLPFPLSSLVSRMITQVGSPEGAEAAVASTAAKGVDYIKLIRDQIPTGSPELSDDSVAALIKAAHAHWFKVFVHVGSADDALVAARAGADALAHMVWRSPLTREQAQELGKLKVPVIFTLGGWEGVRDMVDGAYQPTALDRALSPKEILDPVTGEGGKRFAQTEVVGEMAKEAHANAAHWPETVRLLVEAHVPVLVGTDAPLPGAYPGSGMHHELQRLSALGVPNAELLLGATSRAARLLSDKPGFGTVEPGQAADLLLVEGDPLADISACEHIVELVQGGRRVERLQVAR